MAETKINANQTNITASDIGGLTNNTSNSESLSINGTISGNGSYNTAIQGSITSSNAEKSVAIGYNANVYSHYSIALGAQAYANYYAIAIGRSSRADDTNAIAIGVEAEATAANAIQLGAGSREVRRNTDANTFKVGNANGNFEMMSADGTVPMARIPYTLKTITSPSASGYAANTIVQYVGTTDATCTNGYFYKAGIIPSSATISQTTGSGLTDIAVVVSTFETKISTTGNYNFTYVEDALAWVNPDNYFITLADYGISYTGTPADGDVLTVAYVGESNSWTQVDVQPSSGGGLPSQTGNAGKFLTTDGTDASWGQLLVDTSSRSVIIGNTTKNNPNQIANVVIGGRPFTSNSAEFNSQCICIGDDSLSKGQYGITIGLSSEISNANAVYGIAIGYNSKVSASNAIQLGYYKTNSDANTFKVGNANGNFEIMSADGTIPTDRLIHAINKYSTMPTAASTNLGWIVQFTGTTDSTYTHGHLYECVSDGADPATYSWTEVQLGGGGSSYTAGTGIDITGGVISVTSPTVRNYTTASNSLQIATTTPSAVAISTGSFSTAVGEGSYVKSNNGIAIGRSAFVGTDAGASIVIGNSSSARSNDKGAILIGGGSATTQGSGTFSISLSTTGLVGDWHTYKVLDSDGTVPTARLTKVNSTITLTAAGWSSNTQTVSVTGVTADGVVMVSPDPTNQSAYTSAGILCTAQAAGTLTFTCDTVPSGNIDVNVVML